MKKRALDLFCGAGGASMGLHQAGYDVTGVDLHPQPNYPFHFIQADALTFPLEGYDLIWASPPCQAFSIANNIHNHNHPDLIAQTRQRLEPLSHSIPTIIENVPGAPLLNPFTLCGLSFGLNVKRHRLFETNFFLLTPPCPPGHPGNWVTIFGHTVLERSPAIARTLKNGSVFRRKHLGTHTGRHAMQIPWMTRSELSQAIPPAYSRFIVSQLP